MREQLLSSWTNCVCVHVCALVCVHARVHVWVHECVHVYIVHAHLSGHAYMCVFCLHCVSAQACECTCICLCVALHVRVWMPASVHVYVLCTHKHVCMCMLCAHVRVCIYMCVHTLGSLHVCMCLALPRPSSQTQDLSLGPPESRAWGKASKHVIYLIMRSCDVSLFSFVLFPETIRIR